MQRWRWVIQKQSWNRKKKDYSCWACAQNTRGAEGNDRSVEGEENGWLDTLQLVYAHLDQRHCLYLPSLFYLHALHSIGIFLIFHTFSSSDLSSFESSGFFRGNYTTRERRLSLGKVRRKGTNWQNRNERKSLILIELKKARILSNQYVAHNRQ